MSFGVLPASMLYPTPSQAALQAEFVGKRIEELTGPAAIIDVAKARNNCNAMLKTVDKLGCQFRAHVKTHKTTQLAELQVPPNRPLRLIVSTVAEIENLMPLLLRSQADGREIDVLYGVPFAPPALARIADLNRVLQSQAAEARHSERSPISVLIDHPRHLDLMLERGRDGRGQIMNMGIFIKIDTGYHRAGVAVDSQTLRQILDKCPHELMGDCPFRLRGFYSHLGHSYGFSTPAESIEGLMTEIRAVRQLAIPNRKDTPFILSVGATPTVTSAQNLLALSDQADEMRHWNELYNDLKEKNCELELHAGVYPLLDMQQVATGARPSTKSQSNIPATLSTNDIAIRILVEVASVYEERTNKEALITAGSLALGREPCKSYPGWGVVAPWRASGSSQVDMGGHGEQFYDPAGDRSGWIVGRVSQEHGLLTLEAGSEAGTKEIERLKIGDKLLIWPNHACIAAAAYGWYYVVDSESDDKELVRDVWVRWRGW